MDFTERYITKCTQAFDLQLKYQVKMGDHIITENGIVMVIGKKEAVTVIRQKREGQYPCVLFNQEFLQRQMNMFDLGKPEFEKFLTALNEWKIGIFNKYPTFSMSEFWLDFVMLSKFHKVWNGKEKKYDSLVQSLY
jgi:hypothetical protein